MNRLLGVTAAKSRVKRDLGISQVEARTKTALVKQRVKQQLGLCPPEVRLIRQTLHRKFPSFLGLFGRRR